MPTLADLRAVLAESESAGDPAKVEQYVLDPRTPSRRRVPVLAAALIVIVVLGSFALTRLGHEPHARAGGSPQTGTSVHPGLDQLSRTCLDQNTVLQAWGNTAQARDGYGGVAYTEPDGRQCTYEAESILTTHPTGVTSTTVGGVPVYLAVTAADVRTGYVALTTAQVTTYQRSAGTSPDPSVHLYRVVSIPADNPQSVLVTILGQTASQYPSGP